MLTTELKEFSQSLKKDRKLMYKEISRNANWYNTYVWLEQGLFAVKDLTLDNNILKVHKRFTNSSQK